MKGYQKCLNISVAYATGYLKLNGAATIFVRIAEKIIIGNIMKKKKQKAENSIKLSKKPLIKGIHVKGIASYHDEVNGDQRGMNSIYKIQLDDLEF